MKNYYKYLLVFLISSIIFLNKVGAVDNSITIQESKYKQGLNTIRNDMISIRDTILNHFNYDSSNQDYFCYFNTSSGTPSYAQCYIYSKNDDVINPYLVFNTTGSSATSYMSYFYIYLNSEHTASYGVYNSGSYQYYNSYYYSSDVPMFNNRMPYMSGNLSKNGNDYTATSYSITKWTWVDTTEPIRYGNIQATDVNYRLINNLIVKNSSNEVVNSYVYNDNLLDSNLNFITGPIPDPNEFIVFGNNSYGVGSNNLVVNSHNLLSSPITKSIWCNLKKPFDSLGYCNYSYTDLPDLSYDVLSHTTFSVFYSFDFSDNVINIEPNKYYIFTYRFSKFYTPNLSTFVLKFKNDNNDYQIPIDKLYVRDSGSYVDYQLLFDTTSISSTSQLSTLKAFYNDSLGNSYSSDNLSLFGFGVSRYYKLSQFDTSPTIEQINNDYSNNNIDIIKSSIENNNMTFFDTFRVNDHELSYFVTAPLRFINALDDNTTCSPISIQFPHTNQSITINCLRSSIQDTFGAVFTIFQVIMSGLICYRVGIGYFKLFKDLINPNNSDVEVIDL